MQLTQGRAQQPLVTFYDDATGERQEFSRRTFDNWVAKTANLLVEGLDAEPGGRVVLDLPAHWQTAVWVYAAWAAGQTVVLSPTGEEDGVWVTDDPSRAPGSAAEVVGLSLDAMGAPLEGAPAWVTDYAVEVRAYGDRFSGHREADPALVVTNTTFSRSQLDADIVTFTKRHGITGTDRVLVGVAYTTAEALVSGLLAPLHAGGSVILCRNIRQDLVTHRAETERVTAVAGLDASYANVRRVL
ncbi:TIGR03089 family protein [Actinocorallia longicatena]|uniref:TIGR03089 family protein n=1 Tax=Actinocorallia longicatena TaxID=111803 RepID=A0ABP6QKZ8_9ACTN